MIKKFQDFEPLNERYKTPSKLDLEGLLNLPYTYVDLVFDNLLNILMEEHQVSEKSFTQVDQIKNYLESYFDNQPEILTEIDTLKQEDYRSRYVAEKLYHDHFKMKNILND
jgi:hypothetical protein